VSPELERAVRAGWSRETSEDPVEWSAENPSRGQCAVTALLLRELLGGEILIATVLPREGEPSERHAWNRLASGDEVDLTFDQFRAGETLGPPQVVEPDPRIYGPQRLARLRLAVRERLG
jgi:hypothetical protein